MIVKTHFDENTSYNAALDQIMDELDANLEDIDITQGTDSQGSWIRGYLESVGYSNKYYY